MLVADSENDLEFDILYSVMRHEVIKTSLNWYNMKKIGLVTKTNLVHKIARDVKKYRGEN